MAGNVNTAPTVFWRNATRFTRLFVSPRKTKGDTNDYGQRPNMQVAVIQAADGQTANILEIQDYTGKVLAGFDANGHIIAQDPADAGGVVAVALTAAQITTLHSAPVSLVPAPGAGKVIVLRSLTFQFKYGTTQFTTGGAVTPVYHGATANLLSGAIAQATVQGAANATISAGAEAAALALSTNTGVDFYAAGADFAGGGDSTAIVTVWYDTITLG